MSIDIRHGFILSKNIVVPEADSEIYEYLHAKTKAKFIFIKNKDNNKSFTIGFKTIPDSSKGMAHIIEHSLLCGSDKYNVKKPWVELMKGSMATFINAITYSNMTVYPIASQNQDDLLNLAEVYIDAVFNPNLKHDERIFLQEGWHYEFKDDELVRNGVVFNEMKGSFSSPYVVLRNKSHEVLFDNCYHYVSGGDPDVIPELTYSELMAFYNKYYHPTNSCSVLYGNADINVFLPLLDKYLSRYEESTADYSITPTTPFTEPKEAEFTYNINEDESEEKKAYIAMEYLIDRTNDKVMSIAFPALGDALIDSDASEIKNELLSKNLCGNIYSSYNDYCSQSSFTINICNINPEDKDEIVSIVNKGLKNAFENGINKEILESSVNNNEFYLREISSDDSPCISNSIDTIRRWCFDPNEAINALSYEDSLTEVKKMQNNGSFEKLIKEFLIDNVHKSVVLLKPEKGLNAKKALKEREELKAYKESLSKEEFENISAKCADLKARQAEVETPEELSCIPVLSIDQVSKKNKSLNLTEEDLNGVKLLHHEVNTNSIVYASLKFDASSLNEEEIKYASLLGAFMGSVDTENYTYQKLNNLIMNNLGDISIITSASSDLKDDSVCHKYFDVNYKYINYKAESAQNLVAEIILGSKFDSKERLRQLINTLKNRCHQSIFGRGDTISMNRMIAMLTEAGMYNELANGIEYYLFIKDLYENFDSKYEEIVENLNKVKAKILNKNHMIAAVGANENDKTSFAESLKIITEKLPTFEIKPVKIALLPERREAIAGSSNVQYVGKAYNFKKLGYSYNGAMAFVETILKNDFLWNNIRVLGGAYGAWNGIYANGNVIFTSYRDPQLSRTLEEYNKASDFLKNFQMSKDDLNKYVLGTVKKLDMPLHPEQAMRTAVRNYITHNTEDMRQQIRDEILNVKFENIVKYHEMLEKVLNKNVSVTVGNSNLINENKELFDNIINL